MTITYTNRKGQTYWLGQVTTKTGRPRYVFARTARGTPVTSLPAGYHIAESINGVVSLAKDRPQAIAPEELAVVEAALQRHGPPGSYRAEISHDYVVVYERQGADVGELAACFGLSHSTLAALMESLDRSARYGPILRFGLLDPQARTFAAERWHFSGSIDGWFSLAHMGRLADLADALIPVLGTDAYFDLG